MSGVASAFAADVVAPAPAAIDWSGFYLGAQTTIDLVHFNEVTPFNLASATNIGGGLNAQYLHQRDRLVFGLVVDGNLLTGDNKAGCIVGGPALQCQVGSAWSASARAKIGYASNRLMLYGTAGWGWADTHVNVTNAGGITQGAAHTLNGWVAGAGVSYAINTKWVGNLEYLHYDLGSANVTQFVAFGTGSTKPTSDAVTLGLSYKF